MSVFSQAPTFIHSDLRPSLLLRIVPRSTVRF